MREQRRDDLDGLLNAEIGRLFQRYLLIASEIADAQDVGLQCLQARQQGRVVGGADRMTDIAEVFDIEGLADLEEAVNHLVAVGIVRGQERDLLAELWKRVTAYRARRQMRIQGFMEGVFAEVGGFIDGIGLADRIIDDAAFLGDIVDRELNGGGETADDEIHLFLLDQFQGPRRRLAGIELVVAHDQFRLAPAEATAVIELGNRDLRGAHLILGFGAVGSRQGNREPDLDGGFLRLQKIDAKRRSREGGSRAHRRQQSSAGNRSVGDLPGHDVLLWILYLASSASSSFKFVPAPPG